MKFVGRGRVVFVGRCRVVFVGRCRVVFGTPDSQSREPCSNYVAPVSNFGQFCSLYVASSHSSI